MKTKTFAILATLLVLITSCVPSVKKITSLAKQELKAKHEYRDSETWGKVVERQIKTASFSQIEIKGAVDVVFTQNDSASIKAYGNEKAISCYDIKVEDNVLKVSLHDFDNEKGITAESPAITLFITAPMISKLSSHGAGEIKLCDKIEQSCGLDVVINGAGDIDIKNVNLDNLSINVNGSGDVSISKAVCEGDADITINGAGEVDAKIKCANASLIINGAGEGELNVNCNKLTARCNGAGDIVLKGECNELYKSDGFVSSVDSRSLKVNEEINIVK